MDDRDPLAPSYERDRPPLCGLGILLFIVVLAVLVWVLVELVGKHVATLLGGSMLWAALA